MAKSFQIALPSTAFSFRSDGLGTDGRTTMDIKNITVAGGGVLGSQIALQSAYKGFSVTMWLRSEGSIERAKPKLERLRAIYKQTLEAMKTDPAAYCRGLAD